MGRFKKWKAPKLKKIRGIKCWESKWLWRVWHNKKNFHNGHATDIGTDTEFFCHEPIWIGDKVQIGAKCIFYTYHTENQTRGQIIIGKGALIGARCTILPGVTIKAGEKIPAGSIVYFRKGERLIK
jgi:acetyltransferase-like isoleucine patch superfamily enzyme